MIKKFLYLGMQPLTNNNLEKRYNIKKKKTNIKIGMPLNPSININKIKKYLK